LFVRVLCGIRISITIGVLAAIFQMFIGVLYGGIAGSRGGVTDEILMRIADIIYSIPYLIIVILLTVVMGNNEFTLILLLLFPIGQVWQGL
jgi:ABC-type dipeptide/oligopeptide/nickel transport system permease subunit